MKTRYTYVRGYVIDTNDKIRYTSSDGHLLFSGISIGDYYTVDADQAIASFEKGGVETNNWVAIVGGGIFLAGLGYTAYTCYEDGLVSWSCGINVGLTVIPVGRILSWTGKLIPKSFVLRFYNSSVLAIFAESLGKVVDDLAKLGLLGKLKPIKSIDSHVFEKHTYGAVSDGSKFLQGADIEAVIKEGYGKTGKRAIETTSTVNNISIPSIQVEVDMGKIIGTSKGYGENYSKLSIIVDYEGNVISAYPIANFRIN